MTNKTERKSLKKNAQKKGSAKKLIVSAERKKYTHSLSSTLPSLSKKLFEGKNRFLGRLISNWTQIVGREISKHATPYSISAPKQNDKNKNHQTRVTLTLSVKSSAVALELQYQIPFLLEKMNRYLGYSAITEVKFIHNPSALKKKPSSLFKPMPMPLSKKKKEAVQNTIEQKPFKDPELEEILKRLGLAIAEQS